MLDHIFVSLLYLPLFSYVVSSIISTNGPIKEIASIIMLTLIIGTNIFFHNSLQEVGVFQIQYYGPSLFKSISMNVLFKADAVSTMASLHASIILLFCFILYFIKMRSGLDFGIPEGGSWSNPFLALFFCQWTIFSNDFFSYFMGIVGTSFSISQLCSHKTGKGYWINWKISDTLFLLGGVGLVFYLGSSSFKAINDVNFSYILGKQKGIYLLPMLILLSLMIRTGVFPFLVHHRKLIQLVPFEYGMTVYGLIPTTTFFILFKIKNVFAQESLEWLLIWGCLVFLMMKFFALVNDNWKEILFYCLLAQLGLGLVGLAMGSERIMGVYLIAQLVSLSFWFILVFLNDKWSFNVFKDEGSFWGNVFFLFSAVLMLIIQCGVPGGHYYSFKKFIVFPIWEKQSGGSLYVSILTLGFILSNFIFSRLFHHLFLKEMKCNFSFKKLPKLSFDLKTCLGILSMLFSFSVLIHANVTWKFIKKTDATIYSYEFLSLPKVFYSIEALVFILTLAFLVLLNKGTSKFYDLPFRYFHIIRISRNNFYLKTIYFNFVIRPLTIMSKALGLLVEELIMKKGLNGIGMTIKYLSGMIEAVSFDSLRAHIFFILMGIISILLLVFDILLKM